MRRPDTARRVLVVDPDGAAATAASNALRAAGVEAIVVGDAETGLRRLAAVEPHVLLLELELPRKDGLWLLRRLRDDYMGARPRVVIHTRRELVKQRLGELGADALVLKPAPVEAIVAAALDDQAAGDGESQRLRELVRLSVLAGDMQEAVSSLAKRLSLLFRTDDCEVLGQVGEKSWTGQARLNEEEDASRLLPLIRASSAIALAAGVPCMVPGDDGKVLSLLGVPIESAAGNTLGHVLLVDEKARLLPADALDGLRGLGQRLYAEMAWRSVHERIAADRDRLRETSMLDPMLPGVWTRAALDQSISGEVSACQRRGEPMTVAMVSLRGLRHLNERYGHVVGDEALRHMAALIRSGVRTQDHVARFGGDAMAIMLAGTPQADATRVVERIEEAIAARPLQHGDKQIPLAVVAGIAALIGEDDTGEAALVRAAVAMKAAKRRREPIAVADAELGDDLLGEGAAVGMGLENGTTLGGMYQILHEISRGAMGVVYRAEDLGLGRPVALKTLRPDLARDRNFVERFRTEAAMLASLRHENLVQVYAFGVDGDDVYFVMELVEGEPLEDRVELARHEGRLMPLDEVTRVIDQIAAALDAMHQAGILHRDVKPANILLDRVRERAVLVDVGIAKRRGTEHDPAGTPGYTAPESFSGGTEVPASDVYGLAATTYTLLCTIAPFGGGTVEEILRRQSAQATLPSSLRPGLPPAVDEVLLRGLESSPSQRFAAASAFAGALTRALRDASPQVRAGLDHTTIRDRDPELIAASVPAPGTDGITAPPPERLEEPQTDPHARTANQPRDPMVTDAILGDGPSSQLEEFDDSLSKEWQAARPLEKTVEVPPVVDAAKTGEVPPPILDAAMAAPREPEQPPDKEPHTRGVLFRSAYRVLGARHGAAWVALVSRRDPALAQALQPQTTLLSWHPTELFVTMLRAIGSSGRDAKAFARELGRIATGATFSRFFGANPAALSPWQVISSADLFWRRYHTWGVVGVEKEGDVGAIVAIGKGPGDALVCASTAGILEQVAILAGATQSTVSEASCEAAANGTCRFRISWAAARSRIG